MSDDWRSLEERFPCTWQAGAERSRVSVSRVCSIEGCTEVVKSRGWCGHHYYRWWKYGDPLGEKRSRKSPVELRFWSKVAKGDGCWEWQAFRNRAGYGLVRVDGASGGAHRLAWELTFGPIPDGLFVCHHCDNPACVRPDHLFLGTSAENNTDRARKGRNGNLRGERHPNAKFSDADIREAHAALDAGATPSEVAARFGMSASYAKQLRNGRRRTAS